MLCALEKGSEFSIVQVSPPSLPFKLMLTALRRGNKGNLCRVSVSVKFRVLAKNLIVLRIAIGGILHPEI